DNAYHVVVSVGNVGTAELNGFTVSGGNANGPIIIFGLPKSINYGMGGGIYIESSSPLLTNLRVTGNNTGDIGMLSGGGGIYNDNSFPLLTNVVISGNNSNDKGGGIYNHGSSP